jgi:Cyclic nucleotide-binding domain
MTINTDRPAIDISPGCAAKPRSWLGTVRSVFAKRQVATVVEMRPTTAVSHPSQPVTSLLATIPALRFATPERLQALASASQREAIAIGQTITQQGEDGDDVFFIVDGVYEVSISHFGHSPDFIRELRGGDSFGELGVLYDVPRTATVRCTTAGHVLRIPGMAFMDALDTGA